MDSWRWLGPFGGCRAAQEQGRAGKIQSQHFHRCRGAAGSLSSSLCVGFQAAWHNSCIPGLVERFPLTFVESAWGSGERPKRLAAGSSMSASVSVAFRDMLQAEDRRRADVAKADRALARRQQETCAEQVSHTQLPKPMFSHPADVSVGGLGCVHRCSAAVVQGGHGLRARRPGACDSR